MPTGHGGHIVYCKFNDSICQQRGPLQYTFHQHERWRERRDKRESAYPADFDADLHCADSYYHDDLFYEDHHCTALYPCGTEYADGSAESGSCGSGADSHLFHHGTYGAGNQRAGISAL